MEDNPKFIGEERISLASVINNIKNWFLLILKSWKTVLVGSILIGLSYLGFQHFKKVTYKAETTFVLESEGSSGLGGQLSSLANLAGVNLGSLAESSSLFQLDNITELYKSYRMLKATFLTREGEERLITRFAKNVKLSDDWADIGVNFEIPVREMGIKHDSLIKESVEILLKKGLAVGKPNRKLSILSVSVESTDQMFAHDFNNALVRLVNGFYADTKTVKTTENLRVLKTQGDSVKRVLDQSLLELAKFEERNPNLNPLRTSAKVPMQKLQIDVQASAAVYQEIIKNLEIAKIAHRNNQPLIQIIDYPVFPLADNSMKWYKALVLGLIFGGFLMVFYLTAQSIYTSVLSEEV